MDYLKTLSFIGVMSGLVAYIEPRCSENTTKLKKKMNKNKIPHSPYSAMRRMEFASDRWYFERYLWSFLWKGENGWGGNLEREGLWGRKRKGKEFLESTSPMTILKPPVP